MKKYIFFDIDGTLTTGEVGKKPTVLASTKATLQKLKEAGHLVGIATGRPYFMTKDFAKSLGIEHIVCNGGNDVYSKGICIQKQPLDYDVVQNIIAQCLEKKIAFCVAIDHSLRRYTHNDAFLKLIEQDHFLGEIQIEKDFDYASVKEYTRLFMDRSRIHEVTGLDMVVGSQYHHAYVIVEPDDKYQGILTLMQYYNAPIEDIVVFGDGNNDIKMFQSAPFSVAMGNAVNEVKDLADFITKRSDDDGIAYACAVLGWIKRSSYESSR